MSSDGKCPLCDVIRRVVAQREKELKRVREQNSCLLIHAKRAGAWLTADGKWVSGQDPVWAPLLACSLQAQQIQAPNRKWFYSSAEEANQ